MNKLFRILIPAAVLAIVAGCTREKTLSTGDKVKEYLELYMSANYPDIKPDQWGMYILEDTPGTGAGWNKEYTYSYLRSTIRSIDGTILSTTEADVAKQLDQDSYKAYNYYGPRYQATTEENGYAGLEYMLEGMKYGGRRTAVIPAWLLNTSRLGSMEEYLSQCTASTSLIYSIVLEGQCQDVQEQQISDVKAYLAAHNLSDEPSYTFKDGQKEGTFYFVSDTTAFKADDKRDDTATLSLKYTGRRLDGQAFDTNDQATAVKEGLDSSDKEYKNASVKFSADYTSITMNDSSSLIEGFKYGLYKMHWAGQKATVIFISDYGYTSSGSGDCIPPFAPLIFELELIAQ